MVKGNTAVIVGALYAGCDCYFGYPITPASEVLHEASKYFPKVGRTFIQAESEEVSIFEQVFGVPREEIVREGSWADRAAQPRRGHFESLVRRRPCPRKR